MSDGDELDGLLNDIGMGRWQVMGLVANFLIWTVLSPHTIGTTLLNAPVPFQCFRDLPSSLPHISNENKTEYSLINSGVETKTDKIISLFDGKCFEEHSTSSDLASSSLPSSSVSPSSVSPNSVSPSSVSPSSVSPSSVSLGSVSMSSSVHYLNASSSDVLITQSLLQSCPYILYDNSLFTSTVTTEWHLVCEQSAMRTLFQNSYTVGLIIGCFIGGNIGDRLGRARAVLFGSFIHAVATIIVAFTTNFLLLLIGRFFVGLTNLMILVPVVTLSMETCPERFRGPIGMLVGLPYSFGVIIFAAVGIFLREWRHLYIATSFPALLLIPVAWVLDESPRWLLQVGRMDEAKEILTKAAKINGKKFDSSNKIVSVLENVMKKETKSKSANEEINQSFIKRLQNILSEAAEAMKYPAMRKIFILCPTVWFLNEVVYYATIFNANTFSSDNPFLYVALIGVGDALGIILGIVGTYFGRKLTVAGGQIIAGSLLLLVLAIPEDLKWLQWILVMTGFLMCACASQALFVYTPELFPTTVRARGFAFSNLTGYTGTLMAPFIPDFLAQYGWWLTSTIVGSLSLVACCMIMCLVETNHLPLCETIQDVEDREKAVRSKKSSPGEVKSATGEVKSSSEGRDAPLKDNPASGGGITNTAFVMDKDV